MNHIQCLVRDEQSLIPGALYKYIAWANPARFTDAYAASLDLHQPRFRHGTLQETGSPPCYLADMLKINLYGYLSRLRSSRHLERDLHRREGPGASRYDAPHQPRRHSASSGRTTEHTIAGWNERHSQDPVMA